MIDERTNDTPDNIFNGSYDEEESQDTVNQVLDKIKIKISGKMAKALSCTKCLLSPSTSRTTLSNEEIEWILKTLEVD